jgi:hypothetical protein
MLCLLLMSDSSALVKKQSASFQLGFELVRQGRAVGWSVEKEGTVIP